MSDTNLCSVFGPQTQLERSSVDFIIQTRHERKMMRSDVISH